MTSDELINKCLEKLSVFDDRKSIPEYLLVGILKELTEINKKLEKPKLTLKRKKRAKK